MILGSAIKPITGKHPQAVHRTPFYSPIASISENRRLSLTPNMMYFGPPTRENNEAWENICGEGGGRVGISDKRVLRNLPPSIKGWKEGEFIYGIGVCHQLHCLNYIRLALYEHSSTDHGMRLDRCVEFLRQVLTCKADTAMHYWKKAGESAESAWDVSHQCWSFNKVLEWGGKHKITPPPNNDG
ncbi:unnamed protein product [Tuber aestivum]|uniref:Uncharacterized protein n=1 Tax=Tuber aestivum TaxID=59557 RepID=A0A292PZS1_9PEZI|nr:unnamed protein product [Tuber aestivum]